MIVRHYKHVIEHHECCKEQVALITARPQSGRAFSSRGTATPALMDRCVVLCCAWSPLKILKLWPQSQLQHRYFFWSGHLCCFLRVICQHLIRCSVEATAQLLFAKRHCLRGWICPIRSWCFWHSLGKFSEVSYVVIPNQFKSDQNLSFFHFFHFFQRGNKLSILSPRLDSF